VPDVALVTALLRPIRRRLRAFAALEGALRGGALALAAVAVAVALGHLRGDAVRVGAPLAVAIAGAVAGALARGLRRIPLARCARAADAALDGEDRVLSALSLGDAPARTPIGRALCADAAARLVTLAPARAVPARRPGGALALAAGALAAVFAGTLPVRARAVAARPAPPSAPRGRPIPRAALDAEHDAAAAAAAAARRLDDERLAALSADFARTLRGLETGAFADGEALEALEAVEARARAAAAAAERERRAFEAAERGLTGEAATRQAAAALSDGGPDAAERARAALGAEAEAHPAEAARALGAASRGVAGAIGAAAKEPEEAGPRRLARDRRDDAAGTTAPPDSDGERQLERLRRDLDDTAAACRDGAPGCRPEAEDRGRDLAQLGKSAAGADPLRRLERAARQARARLGQGEMRGDVGAGERRFQSAARGESDGSGADGPARPGTEGAPQSGHGPGQGPGQTATQEPRAGTSPGATGQATAPGPGQQTAPGAGEQAGAEGVMAAAESSADGRDAVGADGIGREAGGAPLGRKTDVASRGQDAEARVADAAGPNRAQVIGVAAGRGFASPGYARVFSDYQSAMEDALGATAVPEGQRYLVRRYFDLIRPRAPGRRPGPGPGREPGREP
jgi:hypothetical protein